MSVLKEYGFNTGREEYQLLKACRMRHDDWMTLYGKPPYSKTNNKSVDRCREVEKTIMRERLSPHQVTK